MFAHAWETQVSSKLLSFKFLCSFKNSNQNPALNNINFRETTLQYFIELSVWYSDFFSLNKTSIYSAIQESQCVPL